MLGFAYSVGSTFLLSNGFLCYAKAGKFDQVLLVYFFYSISTALTDRPKKKLVQFMSEYALSMISSRSFIVSCL